MTKIKEKKVEDKIDIMEYTRNLLGDSSNLAISASICPIILKYCQSLNNVWDNNSINKLLPYGWKIINSKSSKNLNIGKKRSWKAINWIIKENIVLLLNRIEKTSEFENILTLPEIKSYKTYIQYKPEIMRLSEYTRYRAPHKSYSYGNISSRVELPTGNLVWKAGGYSATYCSWEEIPKNPLEELRYCCANCVRNIVSMMLFDPSRDEKKLNHQELLEKHRLILEPVVNEIKNSALKLIDELLNT